MSGRDSLQRRLVALMGARLALAVLSLGIALAVDTAVDLGIEDWRGLYGTVAFAFVATALYGFALPRVRRRTRFAAINVATDIGVVSALVHFSGSADTVFAFLYVVIAVYGALLFSRRGALAVAGLASLAFGIELSLSRLWGAVPGSAAALPRAMLVGAWSVHSLAGFAAAALAGQLSSELRRTGEALAQRTYDLDRLWRLHRHTVDSLMSGLLTSDPGGRITSFNPEAERITGLRAAEALGRDVDDVLPGVRRQALAHGGESTRSRVRMPYRNARGAPFHLGVGAYVLRDDAGRPSGHVVIFQDVSEVVEMERELRRSERLAAVGRLSASMAHEIRNPLAAISGSIQVLRAERDRTPTSEQARRLMDIVLRETERLNRLLSEFLEYARPGPMHLGMLPVEEVVAEVLAIFDAARPPGVEVVVEVEAGLCLHADPGGIRQVLWNLLLNAAQAMPEGGAIVLSARPAPPPQELPGGSRNAAEEVGWVELAVRDAGVGIPATALEHVFDPFFTTKPGGTGLGLATVHRIVEEHGGGIRVQSAEGKGTSFHVRLRRAEACG